MAISTASYLLVGTGTADEAATLAAVTNTAVLIGATVDLLGDDTSIGDLELYLILTSTVAVGTIDISFNQQRRFNAGVADYAKLNYDNSVAPINGNQKIPLGRRPCPRYMSVNVRNNATGASASVAIVGKVIKQS